MRIILVGAGHVHLYVAARAEQLVALGAEVLLIDPDRFWYSGLATGMLGGMCSAEADQIDPAPLITAHGGQWRRDRVSRIDRVQRTVHLESGDSVGFDLLSLNVGSIITATALRGSELAWPVKPISNLWRLRQALELRFADRTRVHQINVIGGGASGCEVAASIAALARRCRGRVLITLITGEDRLLASERNPEQHSIAASGRLTRLLAQRGIEIRCATRIVAVEASAIVSSSGKSWPSDVAVLANGLRAPDVVSSLDLPVSDDGSLLVTTSMHSPADKAIFSAGDCATIAGHPRPKLGVFGVRAAPLLFFNLCASIGGAPLREYLPQKRYLSILNLGNGSGFSLWGAWHWHGRSSLWLKNYLDRRFLMQYRPAPPH